MAQLVGGTEAAVVVDPTGADVGPPDVDCAVLPTVDPDVEVDVSPGVGTAVVGRPASVDVVVDGGLLGGDAVLAVGGRVVLGDVVAVWALGVVGGCVAVVGAGMTRT